MFYYNMSSKKIQLDLKNKNDEFYGDSDDEDIPPPPPPDEKNSDNQKFQPVTPETPPVKNDDKEIDLIDKDDEEYPGSPKGTPPDVQIERALKEKQGQLGGKISLDIGSKNMEKISEKNITFDGGSILQPEDIESAMKAEHKKKLDSEIKNIVGEETNDEDNNESTSNNSGGGKKKVLSFNL